MSGRRLAWAAAVTALVVWGMWTPPAPRPLSPIIEPEPPAELGSAFDPARCGTIRGSFHWAGDVPVARPIELIHAQVKVSSRKEFPNPNTPRVADGRLAEAFVFLKGVDLRRSAPWTLPPVTVAAMRTGFVVQQGEHAGRVGIVRRGESTEFVAREPSLHSIRGRGAAFFTQMLPDSDRPVSRKLLDSGLVELSSGSGYYWLRGYLLVSNDPYAAVTRADGGFDFAQVPDGDYQAICLVPNWHVERIENDPEWVAPVRLYFRPPVEKRQRVVVTAGKVTDLSFTFSAADFGQPTQVP